MPLSPSDPLVPDVDAGRLQREIDELAAFSAAPAPAVTRVLFTPEDMRARRFVMALMADAGLQVRGDAAGNIFGSWGDSGDRAGRVGTGSHCDAIPHAGRFDGTVGVLGGIAAVRALRQAGFTPQRPIDVIMFTSEEPTRFGIGCLGSRLLGGAMAASAVGALRDAEGITFEEARAAVGCSGDLAAVELADDAYAAFVELHIEQGPVLERQGDDIGVVSAIAAPASLTMRFEGRGGHAGAVLMGDRQDALVPAARLITMVEELARTSNSPDTVATVGIVNVHPGAVNSIPRQVEISFDIRDTQLEARNQIVATLRAEAEQLAEQRGLTLTVELINADPPAVAAPSIMAAVGGVAASADLRATELVSRAYHDALFMARKMPMGMIFVPSKDGISHRPDEFTSTAEMANGVRVLAATLAQLSHA